jgi:hypothetical protein
LKLFQEWREGKIKENDGRGEFMIYCKDFCKCYDVPPVQQYTKKKKKTCEESLQEPYNYRKML